MSESGQLPAYTPAIPCSSGCVGLSIGPRIYSFFTPSIGFVTCGVSSVFESSALSSLFLFIDAHGGSDHRRRTLWHTTKIPFPVSILGRHNGVVGVPIFSNTSIQQPSVVHGQPVTDLPPLPPRNNTSSIPHFQKIPLTPITHFPDIQLISLIFSLSPNWPSLPMQTQRVAQVSHFDSLSKLSRALPLRALDSSKAERFATRFGFGGSQFPKSL